MTCLTAIRRAGFGSIVLPIFAWAGGVPTSPMPEITVTGQIEALQGEPVSATQGVVTATQLEHRPLQRTGEVLEVVPGLVVTQHSGDGKANQYFLRGFNLDHGTDLATSVDGVPVNMPTHGHGQGYTDINFVIPELIRTIEYRKGPYYADAGNFAAAGTVNLSYRDALDAPLVTLEAGEHEYRRALAAGSTGLAGGDLLLALDYSTNDGPWTLDQDFGRVNALGRFTRALENGGFGITVQAYDADWQATDQVPQRAVAQGLIDRFDTIDPTDGGSSHRYSLAFAGRGAAGAGAWDALAYAVDYRMDLYSNFTYATDTARGDQFEQADDRRVYGGKLSWTVPARITAGPGALQLGLDVRYDDIDAVGLYGTVERVRYATTREDDVQQLGYAAWASLDTRWNGWLRTNVGLRADRFAFDVSSNIAQNSGTEDDTTVGPKLSVVLGPWRETEFFANVGQGFHSNDARGTTITVDPADPATGVLPVDPLVDALGGEVGLRTAILPRTQVSLALWQLRLDSELLFVGDAGITEPNRSSRRTGIELSTIVTPVDWLVLDLDLAWTHARFDEPDPVDPAVGDRIPGAVESVAALGIAVDHPSGWSGGLRFRYFGAAPLIEDDSVRSASTTLVNLEAGYRLTEHLRLAVTLLNVFDSEDNDITYYYESQLPALGSAGAETAPVADIHFHPVEPRTLRLAVTASF